MEFDDNILTSAATATSLSALSGSGAAAASASNAAALAALTELSEVNVRFFTRQPELPQVPNTFLSVPVKLARYGLSEVVNALTQADPPRPFDFLIAGRFLRGDLLKHLTSTASGGEGGIELEYVEALPEPQSKPSRPHPDWIASIDARVPGGAHIVTGCYDSVVRVYGAADVNAPALATGVGHASAVKSVAVLKTVAADSKGFQIVSGSKDRAVRVWQFTAGQNALRCVALCAGHTDSVEAVAVAPGTSKFCSGGWDNNISVWDVNNADTALPADGAEAAAAQPSKKQRKNGATAPVLPSFQPLLSMTGHTGAVTALVYPHPSALYSGSMDHQLKQWDVATGNVTHSWFGTKVVTGIDFNLEANVLASAHHDSIVRVWDPRSQQAAREAIKLQLKSHKGWVAGLKFNPSNAHQLATASYDHTVKVWDLRATLPLFTLRPHTDKVMAVDWMDGDHIVSGGADKQLQTHVMNNKTEQ